MWKTLGLMSIHNTAILYGEKYFIFFYLKHLYLKVPKCENFHRTDFFYFFTIKPLWVGDFRAKIKNSKF